MRLSRKSPCCPNRSHTFAPPRRFVIPAKAGIHRAHTVDPDFRRDDRLGPIDDGRTAFLFQYPCSVSSGKRRALTSAT